MEQDRHNENISQDEEASLIKDLVDKATGPGDFNRLNDKDVDGADVMDLPQRTINNITSTDDEFEEDEEDDHEFHEAYTKGHALPFFLRELHDITLVRRVKVCGVIVRRSYPFGNYLRFWLPSE